MEMLVLLKLKAQCVIHPSPGVTPRSARLSLFPFQTTQGDNQALLPRLEAPEISRTGKRSSAGNTQGRQMSRSFSEILIVAWASDRTGLSHIGELQSHPAKEAFHYQDQSDGISRRAFSCTTSGHPLTLKLYMHYRSETIPLPVTCKYKSFISDDGDPTEVNMAIGWPERKSLSKVDLASIVELLSTGLDQPFVLQRLPLPKSRLSP